MKKELKKEEVKIHKSATIAKLNEFLDNLIDDDKIKKADLISYWLSDYATYLSEEDKFDPHKMKKYKYGEIVKVDLGFNVGSEMGGLHYAVVVSRKDTISSPVLTVIPLSSIKETTNFKESMVDLGTELYDLLSSKIEKNLPSLYNMFESKEELQNASDEKMNEVITIMKEVDRMAKELKKMKAGSFAVINQITTISKMRIYNPRTSFDTLSGVKLSLNKQNMISEALKKYYIKNL